MSWISAKEFFFISVPLSALLLFMINLVAVYYSPSIISLDSFPRDVLTKLDRCYQTLYHTDVSKNVAKSIVVLGDSFGAGQGTEFLNDEPLYGFVRKVARKSPNTFYVFARGGYGNSSSFNEWLHCSRFLTNYTTVDIPKDPEIFLLVFYGGNDLNNNIVEPYNKQSDFSFRRKLRLFLPIFDLIRKIPRYELVRKLPQSVVDKLIRLFGFETNETIIHHPNEESKPRNYLSNGIPINVYPQSAAVELDYMRKKEALGTLFSVLKAIKEDHKNSSIQILYLPAVATSYSWKEPLRVQTYHTSDKFFETTNINNTRSSKFIRKTIKRFCSENKICSFCDTSLAINIISDWELLHGPKDWKHFNKKGYEIVSEAYQTCFEN